MKTIIHLHRPKTNTTIERTSTRKAYKYLDSFRRWKANNQHVSIGDYMLIISDNVTARQQLINSISFFVVLFSFPFIQITKEYIK